MTNNKEQPMNRLDLIRALIDDTPDTTAQSADPWNDWIGSNVIIRTVTMTTTGRLTAVGPDTLAVEDAAWVADSGRWATALDTGDLAEVEPFPSGRVLVGRGAVVDAALWLHDLPREQK